MVVNTECKINKSCGFHVHIGIDSFNIEQMKAICRNLLKFEVAFDMLLPPSRLNNPYCLSNNRSPSLRGKSRAQKFALIGACTNIIQLKYVLNGKLCLIQLEH